ncbi:MAG: hypothetical protein AAGF23_00885 [Acidobacteriota bacterium]
MSTVKEQARQLVEQLPDDATFDDLVYQVHVRQKIEAGIRAGQEERVQRHEDVKNRFLDG